VKPTISVEQLRAYMKRHGVGSAAAHAALTRHHAERATPGAPPSADMIRAHMKKFNVTAAQAAGELKRAAGEMHECPECGEVHAAPGGEQVDPDDAAGVVERKGSADAKRKADAAYGRELRALRRDLEALRPRAFNGTRTY
jgi:hypothetical protein